MDTKEIVKRYKDRIEGDRQRQQKWREKQKKGNKTPLTVWVDKEIMEIFKEMKDKDNETSSSLFSKMVKGYGKIKGLSPQQMVMSVEDRNRETWKRIKMMKVEGKTPKQISDKLNEEGIPTFSNRGRWSRGTIGKLFRETPEYLEG